MTDANVGDRPNLMNIGKPEGGCGCGGQCGCGGHDSARVAGTEHGHGHHSHEHMQAKLDRLAGKSVEIGE
jgi:hypothetical protein